MTIDDDYCTLDPTKICDNCCKCLEADEAYRVLRADMRINDMPGGTEDDDEDDDIEEVAAEEDISASVLEEDEPELPEEYLQLTDIPIDLEDEEEDEFEFGKNLPPIEIDPKLLAEWEAKLADIEKREQEVPKLYGIRRKRES